ncbi:BMP family ABC transporter substrate-binding protein [uncultured Sphaerochaeta sp.]|uniref:BMP family ABC transporter substrate-binding protein n=1 Tax=uncultured Sphaerochaeta sp. TaxID=886478 RepID=UPI002A0A9F9A|nr:BMP family ABC transporter substrate-binding protein [uncultured Sphaerochaeta sp.]
MKNRIVVLVMLLGILTSPIWANGNSEKVSVTDDSLKVILLIPGNLGDKSFFDSANAGMELIKQQYGATVKVIEAGTDSTKWEPAMLDAIDGNWDIIISGNSMTETMNELAEQYPDKKFINFDAALTDTPKNVYSMFYATNDIGYLAGVTAALVTTSDLPLANSDETIGFLGGLDIPGINDFLVGYIKGATDINPAIKVLVSYAGDFGDPAKGKELSIIQYNAGADIIYNVAGGTGLGLMDAAKLKNEYAIGVDSDQAMLFADTDPEKAAHIVTSTVKRIDLALANAIGMELKGTLPYGTYNVQGLKEGAVGLAKNSFYESILTDSIKNKIAVIEQQCMNGEIEIPSAFGMTSEEVNAMRESVSLK